MPTNYILFLFFSQFFINDILISKSIYLTLGWRRIKRIIRRVHMIFKNRREAGKLLGEKLSAERLGGGNTVVIGLLRGGFRLLMKLRRL
jgi:hypothetical protein